MSRASAVQKITRAAKLAAEAAKLTSEAAEELLAEEEAKAAPKDEPFVLTDVNRARARSVLRKMGARIA